MIQVETTGLGKCEHCGSVFTIEGMSADSMEADWKCRKCHEILGPASCGMEEVGTGHNRWKKTKWVGPKGEWVDKEPKDNFKLGQFHVFPSRSALHSTW